MIQRLQGLHHVTALCGDPKANHRFYTAVLGLRLVKRTVNFDDPGTYHLYYGDEGGTPGTLLTFFPWTGVPRGRAGTGLAVSVSFEAPQASLAWWKARLLEAGVTVRGPSSRFGEALLSLEDPDGLALEIVGAAGAPASGTAAASGVPAEHALRRICGVALSEETEGPTRVILTGTLGCRAAEQEGDRQRFRFAPDEAWVDLVSESRGNRGLMGSGSVHHVAFRVGDDTGQAAWRRLLVETGHNVSPVMDRNYFHSIYFREPGGVLFEIATDGPGFTVDEARASLGEKLVLPAHLEPRRAEIVRGLPAL